MIRSFSKHPYALQNQVQGYLRYGKNIARKAEINRDFTNSDLYKQRMIDKFVNERSAAVPDSGLYVLIRGFNGRNKITKSVDHANEGVSTAGNRGTTQTEIQSFFTQQTGRRSPAKGSLSALDPGRNTGWIENRKSAALGKEPESGKDINSKEWRFLAQWENRSSSLFHREKLRMDQKKAKIGVKS